MKKYLTLAVLLGAIAFVSVSYLAQAESKDAIAPAADAAMMAPATDAAAPVVDAFAADSDMCNTMAAAPTDAAAPAPSEEAKKDAYTKCMMGKGHSEEALKAAEEKAAAEAAAATAEAPAAEAPTAEAPAAK